MYQKITMRTGVTNIILITTLTFILCACALGKRFSDLYTPPDPDSSKKSLEWQGVYTGFLPCDDNNFMQVVIVLRSNYTFYMETIGIEDSSRVKQIRGRFIWDDDGNTIILDNIPNEYGSPFFEVGESYIAQLNTNWDNNEDPGIINYVVFKKELNPMLERAWRLTDLRGSWVETNDRIFIVFKILDQRVSGHAGCNSFRGRYFFDDNGFQLRCVPLSRVGCNRIDLEKEFMKALYMADDIQVGEDFLLLISNKQTIARFKLVNL